MADPVNVHAVLLEHMKTLLSLASEHLKGGYTQEGVAILKELKDTREALYEWDRHQNLR